MKLSPESGGNIPIKIFIKVDFPAPFSPIKAWIFPGSRSKHTLFKTGTPAKDLEILTARSIWVSAIAFKNSFQIYIKWLPFQSIPRGNCENLGDLAFLDENLTRSYRPCESPIVRIKSNP